MSTGLPFNIVPKRLELSDNQFVANVHVLQEELD